VDMGMASKGEVTSPLLIQRRVGSGTANLAQGQAMRREQAEESIQSGIEVALAEISKGADILGTGDMGIGNTTPSAAIACAGANPRPCCAAILLLRRGPCWLRSVPIAWRCAASSAGCAAKPALHIGASHAALLTSATAKMKAPNRAAQRK
jgi:hypothetical protein